MGFLSAVLLLSLPMATQGLGDYPLPDNLPPHSWETVGHRVFIHGCNKAGLFNESELALAAKFQIMTVEKGQGEAEPGWAEDKIAAIAAQWHKANPAGWSVFYMNAHFNWHMYHMSKVVEANPSFWVYQVDGSPCRQRGDPSFPQPEAGMLVFNMSNPGMRKLFVDTAVNASQSVGQFNGVFVDGADSWGIPPLEGTAASPVGKRRCDITAKAQTQLALGGEQLLVDLQAALGSSRLVIAKDGGGFYGDSKYCNTEFLSDSYCSCYSCDVHAAELAETCNIQMNASLAAGKRGQVVLMHGEINADSSAGTAQEQFEYTLAAFLITASDASFFGFSDKWYFNGTTWHEEYNRPLGAPKGDAAQGADGVWSRDFEHASVTLDVAKHQSSIKWANLLL